MRKMGRRDVDVARSLLAVPDELCASLVRKTEKAVESQAQSAASSCDPRLAKKWLQLLDQQVAVSKVERVIARKQTSCWPTRQERAVRQCRKYANGLSNKKQAVYAAQSRGNQAEVMRRMDELTNWVYAQESGATGEALEEFRSLMWEMEDYERKNQVDLRAKKRSLAEAARYSCP